MWTFIYPLRFKSYLNSSKKKLTWKFSFNENFQFTFFELISYQFLPDKDWRTLDNHGFTAEQNFQEKKGGSTISSIARGSTSLNLLARYWGKYLINFMLETACFPMCNTLENCKDNSCCSRFDCLFSLMHLGKTSTFFANFSPTDFFVSSNRAWHYVTLILFFFPTHCKRRNRGEWTIENSIKQMQPMEKSKHDRGEMFWMSLYTSLS